MKKEKIMRAPNNPERRKNRRAALNCAVLCHVRGPRDLADIFSDREFEVRAIDLGKDGAGIITKQYLPEKTKLSLQFVVPESEIDTEEEIVPLVSFSGKITYITPLCDRRYRWGVCFSPGTERNQEKFFDLVGCPR